MMLEFIKKFCLIFFLLCLIAQIADCAPAVNNDIGAPSSNGSNEQVNVHSPSLNSDIHIDGKNNGSKELLIIPLSNDAGLSTSERQEPHAAQGAAPANPVLCNNTSASGHGQSSGGHHLPPRTEFNILEFNFEHVKPMYMVTCWLLAACVLKILFHMTPFLSGRVPESAALISLGIVLGVILRFSGVGGEHYKLDAYTFFYFMLPPIVFDSGFHMPNRAFFGNIGAILLYAVIGTVFNAATIGLTLWGICWGVGYTKVSALDCLLYGSLISAVDPVGVLSVFEEVHVNEMLYIIVFGESLLNDAVTVVLYNVFNNFVEINRYGTISNQDIIFGIISFFVVGLGGTFVGVVFGIIAAFVTRFTDHVRVIEPIFIFIFAYLSYLTADMVRMSGIMAAVFCGITMRRYVNANVHRKAATTINYAVKLLAVVSETTVFMFIGLTSVLDLTDFNAAFFFTSLAACAVYRPIGVVLQTAFINQFRTIKLTWLDQFIMSYGGLRGPIAYALCALIEKDLVPERDVLLSACMGVIFFTVFIQGGTIRFLVEGLHIKRATKIKQTMNQRIHERLMDHLMAGVEDIADAHASQYMRVTWEKWDAKFFKPLLLREVPRTRESGIIKTFSKLNVQDAIKLARERGSSSHLEQQATSRGRTTVPIRQPDQFTSFGSVAEALNMVMSRRLSEDGYEEAPHKPIDTALDLQILDAPVRKKDLDDAQARHILDHAMYKPRHREKSRAVLSKTEVVDHEPSFMSQNQKTRWQVRELMSTLSPTGPSQPHGRQRRYGQDRDQRPPRSDATGQKRTKNLLTVPQIAFSRPPADGRNGSHRRLVNEVDDGGGLEMHATTSTDEDLTGTSTEGNGEPAIEMAPRIESRTRTEITQKSPPRQPTAAERQLPWRRTADEPELARREDLSTDEEPQSSYRLPTKVEHESEMSPGLSSVVSDDDYSSSSPPEDGHHQAAASAHPVIPTITVHPDPPLRRLDRVPECPASDNEEFREEQV